MSKWLEDLLLNIEIWLYRRLRKLLQHGGEDFAVSLDTLHATIDDKKAKVAAVYNHLEERLVNVEEGVPVRPLPADVEGLPSVRDLNHLRASVGLLAERKIEWAQGSTNIGEGLSIVRMIFDTNVANTITELVDNNFDWTWNKNNSNLINTLFPNLTKLVLGCSSIPNLGSVPQCITGINLAVHFPNIRTIDISSNGEPFTRSGYIFFENFQSGSYRVGGSASYGNSTTKYIYIGCKGEPTDTIQLWHYYDNSSVTDIEIRDGAKQPIILGGRGGGGQFVGLTEENIVNHILNRLADNNDGEPITITLGSTNLAKLTDEEKHIAIDKNYILA